MITIRKNIFCRQGWESVGSRVIMNDFANPIDNSIASPQTGAAAEAPFSLVAFLKVVESSVASVSSAWVTAEVVGVNRKGTVLYFELAESDSRAGRIARVSAKLWRSSDRILAAFREATGGDEPKAGMRLLARVKPAFHPNYGLSLDIEAIDPSYTLGEIEAARRERRRKLQDAGLYHLNKQYPCPDDFRNVAVISPDEAAALGDFRQVADKLESAGLCRFFYHSATFQGKNAPETLCDAFRAIVRGHRADPLCAVCIVRGGGSVADLAELDHYRIVWTACQIPIPVLTGIGHERDNVLLDEVSSRRFDTPSKVALHIEQAIVNAAQAADADWRAIRGEARSVLESARRDTDALRESVATRAVLQSAESRRRLDADRQAIAATIAAAIPRARSDHEGAWTSISYDAQRLIRDEHRALNAEMEQIVGLGPRNTLARGFAIVRDSSSGHVITSSVEAGAADAGDLTLEFHDGQVRARRIADGS